jgi:5-methylcytosine-specific restriction endonuclease McrA
MAEPVLVLNANFEPINVCGMRRALGLVLADKAMLVLNGRGEVRTASRSFPRPSVIRLNLMVHRPRPILKLSRREVFRRDGYICQYCGKHTLDLTIDERRCRLRSL